MYILSDKNQRLSVGHIIFSGGAGVLIYDYSKERIRLIKWDKIEEIGGCKSRDCSDQQLDTPLSESDP
jgi:hypothetical protein